MAKDTGLREEKCLGELSERGLEAHTGYNVLPRKSTKPQTADRGQRNSKISNSKFKTEIWETFHMPTLRQDESTKARKHELAQGALPFTD